MTAIDLVLSDLEMAVAKALKKHAPMRGPHEGYAVILEELDELWTEVKAQAIDPIAMRKEALHVAAMGVRFVLDVCDRQPEQLKSPDWKWLDKLRADCDHKFIDSPHCLKCGWMPPKVNP